MEERDNNAVIQRAATIMKVIKLAGSPGMDAVAVRLNMQPTHDEREVAKLWFDAFQRARNDKGRVLDSAMEMIRER